MVQLLTSVAAPTFTYSSSHVRLYEKLLHLHVVHRPGNALLQDFDGRKPEKSVLQGTSRALHCAARDVPSLLWLMS